MRPKSLAVSVIMIVLVFCRLSSGKDKPLKLSITNVELHEDKPSRVDARTVGPKSTLSYKLACGFGVENIEVGHVYKATETKAKPGESLVISMETANRDIYPLGC